MIKQLEKNKLKINKKKWFYLVVMPEELLNRY